MGGSAPYVRQVGQAAVLSHGSDLYERLLSASMCSQCFVMFDRPNPALSVSCAHCDMAVFCDRRCFNKAQDTASHHDLLCAGQNPPALELLKLIHQSSAGRHHGRLIDGVARIIAIWRGYKAAGNDGRAEQIEHRVWGGMARINLGTIQRSRPTW